jgi:hypothetical protein
MSIGIGILESSRSAAPSLLLDLYPGAAAAYSLRKLRSAYAGSAIRVQRSIDNAQIDIGFNFLGELDTTTLLNFVGVGNGGVVTWYDQSGNSRNATKIYSSWNFIVISGVLQTINLKPAIKQPSLDISPFTVIGDFSYFMVQKKIIGNNSGINVGSSSSLGLLFSNWNNNNIYLQRSNGSTGFIIGAADSTTGDQIITAFNNGGSMSMYKNNTIYTINLNTSFAIANSQINVIGNASTSTSNGSGSEVIIYTNSQLSNRTEITSNINSFYTIY